MPRNATSSRLVGGQSGIPVLFRSHPAAVLGSLASGHGAPGFAAEDAKPLPDVQPRSVSLRSRREAERRGGRAPVVQLLRRLGDTRRGLPPEPEA